MANAEVNNLALYNRVREVPKEAKKDILAGRFKGKSEGVNFSLMPSVDKS